MKRSWLVGLALALAAGAASAAGWTDERDAPGRAAAMSYRTMQSGAAVAVRPMDNSPLNLKVAAELAQALRQRGIAVADDAPLILDFETATENATVPLPRRGTPWEPRRVQEGRDLDLGRGDAVDAHVDIYSTMHSSLLTGVRKPNQGLRYVLRATLGERAGARLWEGYAEYGEIVSDDERIFAAMAPLLAGMVGQTTAERRFRAE